MLKDLLVLVLFSVLINWVTSLQILNQSSKDRNVKMISLSMALIIGILSGFILRFSL